MAQENVDVLRAVYADWAKGDFRKGDYLAPDVVFEPLVERNVIRGLRGVSDYFREFLAEWSDFRIEAEDVTEVSDDAVLVTERQHATGKRSGADAT